MTNWEFMKKYFISQDIAFRCREIGHKFNLFEKAYIVNHSRVTMQEKLEAWHVLLDTEPDMEIPDSFHHAVIPSFKEWLKWLVEYYEAPLLFKEDRMREGWNPDFFDDFFIIVPTPFMRGDIVCESISHPAGEYYSVTDGTPRVPKIFVLDSEINEWTKPYFEENHCTEIGGRKIYAPYRWDETDMDSEMAYQIEDEGRHGPPRGFFRDHMRVSYLDLEYYRGKLEGNKRFLKYLSRFLRGHLQVDHLIDAWEGIRREEQAEGTDVVLKRISDYAKRAEMRDPLKRKDEDETCE